MDPKELLISGLIKLKIPYTDGQIQDFLIYLHELKKWSTAYNLTGLKKDEDIIIKHFLDSVLFIKVLPDTELEIADFGSGAGFPGIPIKIIRPAQRLVLIESSHKKAAFLRHITRALKLRDVNVEESRLENLGKDYQKKFDIVLSRATVRIRKMIEIACPYVKDQGLLILSKGPRVYEELREIDRLPTLKNSIKEMHKLELPVVNAERNLLLLKCATISQ